MVLDASSPERKFQMPECTEIIASPAASPTKRQHSPEQDIRSNVKNTTACTSDNTGQGNALVIKSIEANKQNGVIVAGLGKTVEGRVIHPVVPNGSASTPNGSAPPPYELTAASSSSNCTTRLTKCAESADIPGRAAAVISVNNSNQHIMLSNIRLVHDNVAMDSNNVDVASNSNNNSYCAVYNHGNLVASHLGIVNSNTASVTRNVNPNSNNVAVVNSNVDVANSNPCTVVKAQSGVLQQSNSTFDKAMNPFAITPRPYAYSYVMKHSSQMFPPMRDLLVSHKIVPNNDFTPKFPPPPPPSAYFMDLGNGIVIPPTFAAGMPVPGFVYGVPSNPTCYTQPALPQLVQSPNSFDANYNVVNVSQYGGQSPPEIVDAAGNKPSTSGISGTVPSYPTVAPTTVSMPAPLSPSASMELVWHGEFDRLFSQYFPHVWHLMPTFSPPSERWQIFKDSAKVRFSCQCGHGWTSMKGRVIFWFHINYSTNSGYVLFKLYGQECMKCKSGNYEHAMWYPEEVIKVIGNVYNRVGQLYYGFVRPPLRIDRRQGKPRNQHNSTLCQACKEGLCKEEWSFS